MALLKDGERLLPLAFVIDAEGDLTLVCDGVPHACWSWRLDDDPQSIAYHLVEAARHVHEHDDVRSAFAMVRQMITQGIVDEINNADEEERHNLEWLVKVWSSVLIPHVTTSGRHHVTTSGRSDVPERVDGPDVWSDVPCQECGYRPPCQCPGNPFGVGTGIDRDTFGAVPVEDPQRDGYGPHAVDAPRVGE